VSTAVVTGGAGFLGSHVCEYRTTLELAETAIRVGESKSEIVYEALPVDDPQFRQSDITRAKEILGWAPKPSSKRAAAGCRPV